jgi:hypothetical protein
MMENIVVYRSAKHKELSEQMSAWWSAQTDFKTKKELAGFLKVHRDTIGEYFSGKSTPMPDIATRLYELTNIACLKPDVGSTSSAEIPPESSAASPITQKGERRGERAVVISLRRTSCPFCAHEISALSSCGYCGQHFVWASLPLDEPSKLD